MELTGDTELCQAEMYFLRVRGDVVGTPATAGQAIDLADGLRQIDRGLGPSLKQILNEIEALREQVRQLQAQVELVNQEVKGLKVTFYSGAQQNPVRTTGT